LLKEEALKKLEDEFRISFYNKDLFASNNKSAVSDNFITL
jgi:hypothetical protein